MIPTTGMCRRPASRSTSGLTRRATDLITRLVRGPRRRAFRAGRVGATGPAVAVGLLYRAGWRAGGFRPGVADIVDLRLWPDLPACSSPGRAPRRERDRGTRADLGTSAPLPSRLPGPVHSARGSGLDRQVPQLGLVGDQVQRGDAAAGDGEADDPDRLLAGAEQDAGFAVHQHRPGSAARTWARWPGTHPPPGAAGRRHGRAAGPPAPDGGPGW